MTKQALFGTTLAAVLVTLLAAPAIAQEEAPAAEGASASEPESEASAEPAPASEGAAAQDTSASGPTDESAPAESAPAESAPAESAPGEGSPVPASPMGSLSVSSNPPGAVYLDDKSLGVSTPAVDLAIEPGTHTLRVVDEASGRQKTVTFHLEAGATLNLNVNLAEALPEATPAAEPGASPAGEPEAAPTAEADSKPAEPSTAAQPKSSWSWMTVSGWLGVGVGTLGLISSAVVMTNPLDPDQQTLGFGLFATGAALLLGGGVMLYLDNELADTQAATNSEPTAARLLLPLEPALATR